MSAGELERCIFVVGVPRSGTTLVQSLLAAHGRITSFTESHFFDRHFRPLGRSPWALLVRHPGERVREFLRENGARPEAAGELGGRPPPRLLLPLSSAAVARRLLALLDRLALDRGRAVWVEKTPRHLRYVPFLERVSGAERRTDFVHVIRQGLEAVASLHVASRHWERPYDLGACAERWNSDLALSLARAASPCDHFVFYEELTARPEATLEGLCAGLELDWQPEILERFGAAAGDLRTPEESWKENVDRRLAPAATSRRVLSDRERRRVDGALRHDLYRRLRELVAC